MLHKEVISNRQRIIPASRAMALVTAGELTWWPWAFPGSSTLQLSDLKFITDHLILLPPT